MADKIPQYTRDGYTIYTSKGKVKRKSPGSEEPGQCDTSSYSRACKLQSCQIESRFAGLCVLGAFRRGGKADLGRHACGDGRRGDVGAGAGQVVEEVLGGLHILHDARARVVDDGRTPGRQIAVRGGRADGQRVGRGGADGLDEARGRAQDVVVDFVETQNDRRAERETGLKDLLHSLISQKWKEQNLTRGSYILTYQIFLSILQNQRVAQRRFSFFSLRGTLNFQLLTLY